ncbi:MAG: phosphotransferase, partial [Calditrichaeota bacterium]|nr:phosphotransferase [Calditrichota bacterium]
MPVERQRIRQIVEDYFLIKHFDMLKLDSYRDNNYHIILDSGQEYVLKISHPHESAEKLELENKAMILLRRNGVPAPEIMPNKHSNLLSYFRDDEGRTYFMRLIRFLSGDILAKTEHTNELFFNIGVFLADVDSKLKFLDSIAAQRYIKWDLRHTLDSKVHLDLIKDPVKRYKTDYFFLQFETHVRDQLHRLRNGLIYNDANDYNLFIRDNKICGIIDFGDMVHSCLIFEVAIACFYIMLKKDDPLSAAVELVKGYHSKKALEEIELDLLYYLIAARLCISVCSSAKARSENPENSYINVTEDDAWRLLDQLIELNPRRAQN